MEYRYRLKSKTSDSNELQRKSQSSSSTPMTTTERRTVDATILPSSSSSSSSSTNTTQDQAEAPPMAIKSKKNNWKKDQNSIVLLLFLYLLQGVPLGMAGSIPLIIQTIGVSWSQQATFSFAFWPFSLKLLWAPIVDAVYLKRFGRRKSWLIPTQYLIGIVMIILSYYINDIIKSTTAATDSQLHIYFLTAIFFGLSFLAATQDVCVDGWALSMLSRENVGWASTCNSVGQTAGYFLGNVVFLALESKDFANRYLRQPFHIEPKPTGLITLPGFLLFWGIIFIISTTFVALLKHEIDETHDSAEPHFGLIETYRILVKVLRLPSVRSFALILLTVKIGFAATDAMTGLELIERGVAKESLALLAIPLTPLQILLPFFISRYTTGQKPLNIYMVSYPFRLLLGLVMAVFVYFTPNFQNPDKTFPWYFYASAVGIYAIHQVFLYNMFVSLMAFYAQVSDPKIGGTYMTLLNTLSNLGGNWTSTAVLYLADPLTWKKCSINNLRCYSTDEETTCTKTGGICRPFIEAYYVETAICTVIGIFWLLWKRRTFLRLQALPIVAWQVRGSRKKTKLLPEDEEHSSVLSA